MALATINKVGEALRSALELQASVELHFSEDTIFCGVASLQRGHPIFQRLAEKMWRFGIAGLTFERGATKELEELIRDLAPDYLKRVEKHHRQDALLQETNLGRKLADFLGTIDRRGVEDRQVASRARRADATPATEREPSSSRGGLGAPHALQRPGWIPELRSRAIHSLAAITDTYDALFGNRSYHDRFDVVEALEILNCDSGTVYSPDLVDRFTQFVNVNLDNLGAAA